MVHRGLSVMLHGHELSAVRDEDKRTATIVCKPTEGSRPIDESLTQELQEAAELLAQRTKRLLGPQWTVTPLDARTLVQATETTTKPVERVAGMGAREG